MGTVHDDVSDNLRNYFMFLAFKKFHYLNINKNDKVLLLEILKLKLSVASVEQMELYTDPHKCEAVNGSLSQCILFSSVADEYASEFVTKFFLNSYL